MNTLELIAALDNRYGNPNAKKENELIHLAIEELQRLYDEMIALREQVQ